MIFDNDDVTCGLPGLPYSQEFENFLIVTDLFYTKPPKTAIVEQLAFVHYFRQNPANFC